MACHKFIDKEKNASQRNIFPEGHHMNFIITDSLFSCFIKQENTVCQEKLLSGGLFRQYAAEEQVRAQRLLELVKVFALVLISYRKKRGWRVSGQIIKSGELFNSFQGKPVYVFP